MDEKNSFLSEGYDFCEDACGFGNPLEYTEVSESSNVILESEGSSNPYKILGVCKGVFQPVGEYSRNKRIYENDHWSFQIQRPDVQERLRTRSMMGTLGHFDRRVDDSDIREGRVSHIVTKLEIREDDNRKPFLYGELEILDTPAGRILEAMYKGGACLYVSSRGAGKLLPIPGDPTMKKVDKTKYFFEGFDIVRAPGFLKAKPVFEGVKESHEEDTAEFVSENEKLGESEVSVLKDQINQLTKIIEKVVDDVYESEESEEVQKSEKEEKAPKQEGKPEKPVNEALVDFIKLLVESNISEEKIDEIIDIVSEGCKGNKAKKNAVENKMNGISQKEKDTAQEEIKKEADKAKEEQKIADDYDQVALHAGGNHDKFKFNNDRYEHHALNAQRANLEKENLIAKNKEKFDKTRKAQAVVECIEVIINELKRETELKAMGMRDARLYHAWDTKGDHGGKNLNKSIKNGQHFLATKGNGSTEEPSYQDGLQSELQKLRKQEPENK